MLRRAVAEHAGREIAVEHRAGRAPLVPGLSVSLSRTDDAAMCAVTERPAIGIDIERMRPWSELEDVARDIAHEPINDALRVLERWTRIEALAKAIGHGLPDDVRSLRVPAQTIEPLAWLRADGWLWLGCPHPEGYVASLVIQDDGADGTGACVCKRGNAGVEAVVNWTIELED
ncbi:MAG: 4'-phosphopantetheinyl transferase family protein [Phycisphaerales bacterium]